MRDEAGDDPCRTRAQGLLDCPEGVRLLLCFDESETPRIEAERLQAMAMKPADGSETRCRGDDEDGSLLGKGNHEG